MQFKTGEAELAALNIKRFTAEFDPSISGGVLHAIGFDREFL